MTVSGSARPWRTRPPAAKTQSGGPLPPPGRGGRPCARTPAKPCATSPLSAVRSPQQRGLSNVTAAARGPAPRPLAPPAGAAEHITLPTATIFVAAAEWDARADALGGTSNTLLAAFAARLAQGAGRVATDGSVTLTMPINERTAGDTRANAITNVDITVDPTPATTDLREIRAATKQALIRHQEEPDERWTLLPLVPLVPERLGRRWVGAAINSATSVGASNVG